MSFDMFLGGSRLERSASGAVFVSRGLLMDLQPRLQLQNGRSPREDPKEEAKRPLRGPERFFYVPRRLPKGVLS